MFKKTTALLAMLLTGAANAEIINADWLTEADGKGAYDTVNQQFWVDLTETQGMSVNHVTSLLETDYQGFRIANQNDIFNLYNTTATSLANNAPIGNIGLGLGVTLQQTWNANGNVYRTNESRGWYANTVLNEMHGAWEMQVYVASGATSTPSTTGLTQGYSFYKDKFDHYNNSYGVYLVKDDIANISIPGGMLLSDVSTPLGVGVASLALLCLRLRRRSSTTTLNK
jgi:hypothetical protein